MVTVYRSGIKSLVDNKFNLIDDQVVTLKSSVNEAISTAKNSCTSGANGDTVRTTLKDNIKSAHVAFNSSRIDDVIKAELESLNAAKKTTIDQAVTKFKSDMDKATADLKIAFGK